MMDEESIFDILECSVCLERLDATSRVLPCQHTFCMRCLQQILNVRKEIRCPECRDLAPHKNVTDLPTNILLVRLLDGMKRPSGSAKAGVSTSSGSSGGQLSSGAGDAALGTKSASSKIPAQNPACARALYKYEAQEPSDLSFNKGAIVNLLKRIDDNWYHGELDGNTGFFPASYVDIITPLPPDPPQCKALYDFDVDDQEEKDCLPFVKDEVLNVIRKVDENWIEGQKGDKIGIFPRSFVELNDTAKSIVDSQSLGASGEGSRPSGGAGETSGSGADAGQTSGSHESSSSKNKSSNKRHSFTSMLGLGVQLRSKDSQEKSNSASGSSNPSNRHSMEISSPVLVRSSNPTAATLIDPRAAAGVAMATGSSSPATTPSPSTSPSPGASASGGSSQGASGGGRKKPAPLTLLNQSSTSGGVPPNSPSLIQAGPGTPTPIVNPEPPSSPKPRVEVYVAMYNYKPLNADEVELKKGEFYTVTEKCKDGWYKGMSLVSGQIGVFPGNYMQPYRTDKQKKSSSASAGSTQQTAGAISRSSTSSQQGASAQVTSSSASGGATGTGSSEKKPFIMQVEGQKTIAQLQSERAVQQMPFRTSSQSTSSQGAVSRPVQAPQPRQGERQPHGSPPGLGADVTGLQLSGGSSSVASSWPGNPAPIQHVSTSVSRAGQQVHAGSQTNNAGQAVQTVRPRTAAQSVAHTHSSQLPPSSPPVAHSSTMRTNSVPLASGVADNNSMQPGVPVRQACSQMAPHQKEKKERKNKKSSGSKHTSNEAPELTRTTSPSQPPSGSPGTLGSPTASHLPASPETRLQDGADIGMATSSTSTSSSSSPSSSSASAAAGGASGSSEAGARGGSDRVDPTKEQSPPKTTPLLRERYRVIVPYPPTTNAELELKIGDTVFVHKKREDGWFKGTLHRTGKTGLFPGSFVEPF